MSSSASGCKDDIVAAGLGVVENRFGQPSGETYVLGVALGNICLGIGKESLV